MNLLDYKAELADTLREKLIPFWLTRSVDTKHGGYLTSFDENGDSVPADEKYLVTQSRMIWGFSRLKAYARSKDQARIAQAARQGVEFLLRRMWDDEYGGFFWKVDNAGNPLDAGKLIYGQVFAIYALSEYGLVYRDDAAIGYAKKTFELLQIYAADTAHGGYFENLERDWRISRGGKFGGDRKSLDIHMHIMESFSTLYRATGEAIHKRKLREVMSVITKHMISKSGGYGLGQFALDFTLLPAIDIARTWNAERESGTSAAPPLRTTLNLTSLTSYGHNLELGWLLDEASKTAGCANRYHDVIKRLLEHTMETGFDARYGGIYRDGAGTKGPINTDKEWWQNFEALPGFLNGYLLFRDETYAEAFLKTWELIDGRFLNKEAGESRQLLSKEGKIIIGDLGNPWKGIYHTGRALAECIDRLELLATKVV